MATGANLALAEGLQVDTAPREAKLQHNRRQGQPVPGSWHPGCQHHPLENAFHAARLDKRGGATAERSRSIASRSRQLPAHFLPAAASPGTPVPAFSCQVPLGKGQMHPYCPAWLLAVTEPQAKEGNRPWRSAHLQRARARQEGVPQQWHCTHRFRSYLLPCPAQPMPSNDQPASSSSHSALSP